MLKDFKYKNSIHVHSLDMTWLRLNSLIHCIATKIIRNKDKVCNTEIIWWDHHIGLNIHVNIRLKCDTHWHCHPYRHTTSGLEVFAVNVTWYHLFTLIFPSFPPSPQVTLPTPPSDCKKRFSQLGQRIIRLQHAPNLNKALVEFKLSIQREPYGFIIRCLPLFAW